MITGASSPIADVSAEGSAMPFREAAEGQARRAIAASPPSERHAREAALSRFLAHGLPTPKDEEWKYTSLRRLGESEFAAGSDSIGEGDLARIVGLADGPRLVFVNGVFEPKLSRALPSGVEFRRLAEAQPEGFGVVASLEGRLGSTNDERFFDLNSAAYSDGAWLEFTAGASVEPPVQVVFFTTGDPARLSFPRLFVRAQKGAIAKVVEFHVGSGSYASVGVSEYDLAEDANLESVRIQDEASEAFHLALLAARQARSSTFTSTSVQFGASIGRIDANVWVGGEHSETWLNGAYVGRGEQHLDNHTRIDHAVPNCHSFEVYKGILGDHATGVFNGKIFVYPDAQKTDAKQTNQALLLSPTATIDTKPQLEIFADDVKCTHGATVGQLRDDAMFYLRSRGIPEADARNLLVYAFVAEVLEKVGIPALREALEYRLFEKLGDAPSR